MKPCTLPDAWLFSTIRTAENNETHCDRQPLFNHEEYANEKHNLMVSDRHKMDNLQKHENPFLSSLSVTLVDNERG